jgi:hypothetical protein
MNGPIKKRRENSPGKSSALEAWQAHLEIPVFQHSTCPLLPPGVGQIAGVVLTIFGNFENLFGRTGKIETHPRVRGVVEKKSCSGTTHPVSSTREPRSWRAGGTNKTGGRRNCLRSVQDGRAATSLGPEGAFQIWGRDFPGIGKSFPLLGKSFPCLGKSLPNLGKSFPDLGKSFPCLGKSFPDLGKSFPDLGKSFPDLGKSFPDLGKSFPCLGKSFPCLGKSLPNPGKSFPRNRKNFPHSL